MLVGCRIKNEGEEGVEVVGVVGWFIEGNQSSSGCLYKLQSRRGWSSSGC